MCRIMQCCRLCMACYEQQSQTQSGHEQHRYHCRSGGRPRSGQRSRRFHRLAPSRHTRRQLCFTLQGRSPGSRVTTGFRLPIPVRGQWPIESPLTAYSRGGGWGFGRLFRSARSPFPFQSLCFAQFRTPCHITCAWPGRSVKTGSGACGRIATRGQVWTPIVRHPGMRAKALVRKPPKGRASAKQPSGEAAYIRANTIRSGRSAAVRSPNR